MRRLLLATVALGIALSPARAAAHSDQRLATGEPVRWHQRVVGFAVDPSVGTGEGIGDPMAVVAAAARAWEGIAHAPRFALRAAPLGPVGYDATRPNTSGIALYRRGFPQRLDRPVLALTLLTRNSVTGEIVDADILVDAEHNRFARLLDARLFGVAGAPNDYQNVVTHEFGHALGLVEDPGAPEAVMFPSSQPGEVRKRTLTQRDRESVARAYVLDPELLDPRGGGCGGARVAPGTGGVGALGVCVTALCALALRPRRRRSALAVTVAVGLLALGAPTPRETTRHGLVLRARTSLEGGVMRTRAVVRTAEGDVRVERLGGRHGALEQVVLDAPSGSALRPGATVRLGARE